MATWNFSPLKGRRLNEDEGEQVSEEDIVLIISLVELLVHCSILTGSVFRALLIS